MAPKTLAQKLMAFGYKRSQAFNIAATDPADRTPVQTSIIRVITWMDEFGVDMERVLRPDERSDGE